MFFEYDCAEEAVYGLGGCAEGLLEVLDNHTIYARPQNGPWMARLARVRELANQLCAETDALYEEWAKSIGEIP